MDESSPQRQPELDGRGVFPGDPHVLERLRATSNDARDALEGCVGLSISVRRAESPTFTFVRTDALPGVLDAMQYLQDGPCETSMRTGEEIRIDDLLEEGRWPLFTTVSAAAGIRSTLSLPLYRGPRIVGSVNIYGEADRAFVGKEAVIAETFGSAVQQMIANANLSSSPIATAPTSAPPSGERTTVDQAVAVLVAKHGIPTAAAEPRLVDAAARARTSVTETANAIVMSM